MSDKKGIYYKLSVNLLKIGVVITSIAIILMFSMMISFDNLINLTYLSLTSFLFGAGLSLLITALYLRLKAGKTPYLREESTNENLNTETYSSDGLWFTFT